MEVHFTVEQEAQWEQLARHAGKGDEHAIEVWSVYHTSQIGHSHLVS